MDRDATCPHEPAEADASHDGVEGAASGCGTSQNNLQPAEDVAASTDLCAGACGVGALRQTERGAARISLQLWSANLTEQFEQSGSSKGQRRHFRGPREQIVGDGGLTGVAGAGEASAAAARELARFAACLALLTITTEVCVQGVALASGFAGW